MNPLATLYGTVVQTRNGLYDRGKLPIGKLRGPVVSIGNLNVGGSGKTPFLIALGKLLQQRGIAFDVLSRGYRRATRGVALVDPAGSPRDFGDEPILIVRKLGVPVVVGEDRYQAGQFAEQRFGPQLHLLDDGFQHRRLARDFDIVLITPSDTRDTLLPTGRLREPLSSLARADAVVLTNEATSDGLPLGNRQVWRASREIIAPRLDDPCIAFCGLARPTNFFADLASAGLTVAGTKSFADHHAYTKADVRKLRFLGERYGAAAFVTTEKDAINLGPLISELTPLHVVPVQLRLQAPDAAMDWVLSRIAAANAHPHETI